MTSLPFHCCSTQLKDPRHRRPYEHRHIDIVLLASCAVTANLVVPDNR